MKTAVIGCGGIGRAHALAYRQVEGVELTHVVDRNAPRAQALADEVGATALQDLQELPGDVSLVSVATDPASHAPVAEACLRRGLAVFCEKPLGMTIAEARGLLETSRETGRALSVGFKMRYEAIFVRARELCPEVGPVVQIATTKMQPYAHRGAGEWRPRVGAMFELSVHDFDLISFITGLAPVRVQAATLSRRLGWEREDGFTALVEYAPDGRCAERSLTPGEESPIAACDPAAPDQRVLATLSGCYTTDSKWLGADFALTITGERGYLRVLRGDRIILHTDRLQTIAVEPTGNTFVAELEDFVGAVESGAPPPLPPEAGYTGTALIDAIWQAGSDPNCVAGVMIPKA